MQGNTRLPYNFQAYLLIMALIIKLFLQATSELSYFPSKSQETISAGCIFCYVLKYQQKHEKEMLTSTSSGYTYLTATVVLPARKNFAWNKYITGTNNTVPVCSNSSVNKLSGCLATYQHHHAKESSIYSLLFMVKMQKAMEACCLSGHL